MLLVLRELPAQYRIPYVPRERLCAIRDARVRALVAHAAEHVPHYRDQFRSARLDPREFRTADDLAILPLLAKEEVQADASRFRSARAGDALLLRTHGSTGLPLDVWHDRTSLLRNIAYGERERAVVRAFVGRRLRYRIMTVVRVGSTNREVLGFYDAAAFRPFRPQRDVVPVEGALEDVIDAIERLRPDVLESYGGYVEALFRTIAARDIHLRHRPAVAAYGGEGMTDAGRRLVEERFGIPVVSSYNAVEALKIGFTCEERRGFHLHEDLCHVRVLARDGRPAPLGEPGEVVITNLVNRGSIFLNYRLGDLACLGGRGCPCGRTLALLEGLDGRVPDTVALADGTLVHQSALARIVLDADGIVRSRVVQLERMKFELLLETADEPAFAQAAATIVPRLRALLGGAEVRAVRVPDLAPPPGQKAKAVVPLPLDSP